MAEAFRAFVAVPVGPLPGLVSLLEGLGATGADLKRVDPANLHVTMKFIGTLDADRVADVTDAMREAAGETAPFDAPLEGVGTFGSRSAPRVVFAHVLDEGRLARVAARLDARLADLGVANPERRGFKAHVTLARSRSPRGGKDVATFAQAHAHAAAGTLHVSELVLKRSDLGPAGPTYSDVARVPLGGE